MGIVPQPAEQLFERRGLAVHQHADAEDAVQEVFIEIWRNAGRFDPTRASEATFVAMISRRRLIDRQRKLGRTSVTQTIVEDPAARVHLIVIMPDRGNP